MFWKALQKAVFYIFSDSKKRSESVWDIYKKSSVWAHCLGTSPLAANKPAFGSRVILISQQDPSKYYEMLLYQVFEFEGKFYFRAVRPKNQIF